MPIRVLQTNSIGANPHATRWLEEASRRETDAIGFLPRSALERHHHKGLIFTVEEDGELLGFNIRSPLQPGYTIQIHQAFTVDAVRRLAHQTKLICHIASQARSERAVAIILKCGDDLEANRFWKAIGFEQFDQTRGGKRRGRLINHFRFPLLSNPSILPGSQKCERTESLVSHS